MDANGNEWVRELTEPRFTTQVSRKAVERAFCEDMIVLCQSHGAIAARRLAGDGDFVVARHVVSFEVRTMTDDGKLVLDG